MLSFLFFSSVLICLCSCASGAAVRERKPYVYLTEDTSKFILLPPGAIENSMDMAQQVFVSFQGRNLFLNAWVKADETGLDMTLLNELGATMGELFYRDGAVSLSSSVLPGSLDPGYIVADFQFCFYNAPALQQALEACGLSFESTGNSRRILQGKYVVAEIEKSSGSVRLINHARGYTYTLKGDFE